MTNEELQQAIAWFENRLSSAAMPGTRKMFGMALLALRERQEREKEHIGEATNMIPKPVVHGEWIKKCGDGWYCVECSVCGHPPLKTAYGHADCESAFCPNCGCRMDGGEKHECGT